MKVKRVYVEKKDGFDVECRELYNDLKNNLGLNGLKKVRVLNRYDVEEISREDFKRSIVSILSDASVDKIYMEKIAYSDKSKVFAIEYLPGQFDVRAHWAAQAIEVLIGSKKPIVSSSKVIVLEGEIDDEEFLKVKNYCINPVDSREASLEKPTTLRYETNIPEDVKILRGFIKLNRKDIKKIGENMGFAMDIDDLEFCQKYFRDEEKRDPTITEMKVIDTYWSDHCRHTTFFTVIKDVIFEEGLYNQGIKKAYDEYLNSRCYVYKDNNKNISLMDMATIAMKELRLRGQLEDLDISEEINACSIVVNVDVEGRDEEWLIMFKNETHNHPTEIEPFGGAATCLGGAIRDPLSGRAYVYQAMRITGSGDPRTKIEETLEGKLPQRKITKGAAKGYSSYGNQIGLATGHVCEIYDEGYIAKRLEIGAVIGATPKENVIRSNPKKGDLILLVGGKTGRDGCGGATGSSKVHTEESILVCGSEVQKGNPPMERKIQRLFRNPKLSRLIKRCNDFGAGGVSVAIGELAPSLEINLDSIPKKYEGLDGTEIAISESQERMAVVIDKSHLKEFIKYCNKENLEAVAVAKVTNDYKLKMKWHGKEILNLSRDFLNTNGVRKEISVKVNEPSLDTNYFRKNSSLKYIRSRDLRENWIENLRDLNVCSQKGLVEMFDSSIGGGTILMPFGGKYFLTPTEGMVAKVPVLKGKTNTCTIMAHGFDPKLSKWSPFHGGIYSVIHSLAKIVAMGGDYSKVRLTLQEYFEKLGRDEERWGKPFSALLGAFYAQKKFGIAAIGGKDSMAGTFKDLDVPPTLVSFAVGIGDSRKIISPEFKGINNKVLFIPIKMDDKEIPNIDMLKSSYSRVNSLIKNRKILSAHTVGYGGIGAAVSKMAFGNKIGMTLDEIDGLDLFKPYYGALVLEMDSGEDIERLFVDIEYRVLGRTIEEKKIVIGDEKIDLEEAINAWLTPLEDVFPVKKSIDGKIKNFEYDKGSIIKSSVKISKPRVFIPVFPGTNCEYDMARAFEEEGGKVNTFIFNNLSPLAVKESVKNMIKVINNSQIIALPGGFSASDEPDGSGKFIATVFRNPWIKEALMDFLKNKDGLMIGICNGFQVLIKLGLLPFGEIRELDNDSPTLTYNRIGRHVSTMVKTKVTSNLSPWFNNVKVGDIHSIPVSHGEGRFVAVEKHIKEMISNGQIATQYVDYMGNGSYDGEFNPNGSVYGIEGITSPDGRILGKMGHSERVRKGLYINSPGEKDQRIFEAGVNYFR